MPTTSFIFPTLVGANTHPSKPLHSNQSNLNVTSSSSSSLSSLCSVPRRGYAETNEANDYGFIEYRRSATMDNNYHPPKNDPSTTNRPRTTAKYNSDDYASPIRNVIRKSASLLSANWWANRILQHNKSQHLYYNSCLSNKQDMQTKSPTSSNLQQQQQQQQQASMPRRWRSVGTLLRGSHGDEAEMVEERRAAVRAAVRVAPGGGGGVLSYRPRASTLVQHNKRNTEENCSNSSSSVHRRTMSLLNNNNLENKKPQEFYLLDDFLRRPTPPISSNLRQEVISQRPQKQTTTVSQYHQPSSTSVNSSRQHHRPTVATTNRYENKPISTDYNKTSISKRAYSLDTSKYPRYVSDTTTRYASTDQRSKYRSSHIESKRNTSSSTVPENSVSVLYSPQSTPRAATLYSPGALGSSPEPPPVPPPPPSDLLSDYYRRSISDRSCSCRSCDVRLIHDSYASLLQHTNPPTIHHQQKNPSPGYELGSVGRNPSSKLSNGSRLSHVSTKSGSGGVANGEQTKHRISRETTRDLPLPPPPPPASYKARDKGGCLNNNHKLDNQLTPNNNNNNNNNKCGSPCSNSESPRKPESSSKSTIRDGVAYPMTAAEALKLFGSKLTQYERSEITEYPQIWYLGLDACKIHGEDGATQNGGFDDENGSYHKVLHDHIGYRYEILEVIGRGSFGQVIRALDHKTGTHVAIKIIRNKKRFHHQALVEVRILDHLRKKDRESTHNIIHMLEYFYFRNHLCISFELMSLNLYELIKKNNYQGFSLNLIQRFTRSLIHCLRLLHRENIIHCDLKPENVLLKQRGSTGIKVIDFGSSCYTHHRVFTYIQSRFYRSPEVILGLPYGTPIDMWSLGCILAELYTGYPLFPGENEVEQLACVMEVLGLPPKSVVASATRRRLFFDSKGNPRCITNSKGRKRKPASKDLATAIRCNDRLFVDFVSQCLEWDSTKRLTPDEALKHPWLNQTNSTFELTRCSSQENPTPTHRSCSLATTRSESDLPSSSVVAPPPAPPPPPGTESANYSLYRVYKGTRKSTSKERLSSAESADRLRCPRVNMQRESSLPEKSTLDDSGTFLPPIL